MAYDWIEKTTSKKNSFKKKLKKNEAKMQHVNKKPLAKKRICVHKPFSHSA